MERNLGVLAGREYDLAIIGGGFFAACAAWDATLRGLSVALIERDDFGGATSAHSFKMVHGGIRYLQHADFRRMRESSGERRALLRVAPHLVSPLPIVIPTYGHGMKGKAALRLGASIYDCVTSDRNRDINDPQRRVPSCSSLSRQEVLDRFGGLHTKGLTGAIVFSDAQIYNPPRLVLAFLRAAVQAGAVAANYVQATGFIREGDRIRGARARDVLTGSELDIRAKVTLNATGPYAEHLLVQTLGIHLVPQGTYSRDACFVVARRLLDGDHALAVLGRTRDPDAIFSRGRRHLFIVPWRGYTLIGVWHRIHDEHPDTFTVTEPELEAFIDEINEAYPTLRLTIDDVSLWNAGLVPFGLNRKGAVDLRYGHRSRLVDHAKTDGMDGLITLIGVRMTTGRIDGARAIDLAMKKVGRDRATCRTAVTPVHGGEIEDVERFILEAIDNRPAAIHSETMHALVRNYGSAYLEVLKGGDCDGGSPETVAASHVLKAEIVHTVREEMAVKLGDVVFRRTDLATGQHPGDNALRVCADLMAAQLGWDTLRVEKEVGEVEDHLRAHQSSDDRGKEIAL